MIENPLTDVAKPASSVNVTWKFHVLAFPQVSELPWYTGFWSRDATTTGPVSAALLQFWISLVTSTEPKPTTEL